MYGNQSETSIGQPTLIISEGRRHGVATWAKITADVIFNTEALTDEKLVTALMVKAQIEAILKGHFDDVIAHEERDLFVWRRHCGTELNPTRHAIAAMMDVQTIHTAEWDDVVKSLEWSEPALAVIATNMASAMHIERLNFCDDHPDNEIAQAYKLKSQGA